MNLSPIDAAKVLLHQGPLSFFRISSRQVGKTLSASGYFGTNIYKKDWDVLILLDTCRVDALNKVADEYDFINNINSMISVGGTSPEWIAATFNRKYLNEINNTTYLSCNGFAENVLYKNHNYSLPSPIIGDWRTVVSTEFENIEHIWKYENRHKPGKFGHKQGYTPPRYLTDRAIDVARHSKPERLILHYIQPHHPYTSNALNCGRELEDYELTPFKYLRNGGKKEKVFNAYTDDLRYVLDDIKLLLENIDAERVIISADHGEAFDEYGTYGHPFGTLNPYVRKVPIVLTSAKDDGDYSPEVDPIEDPQRDVDDFLKALGYK